MAAECVRCIGNDASYCSSCVRALHPLPNNLASEAIRRLAEIDPAFRAKVVRVATLQGRKRVLRLIGATA